MIRTGSGNTFWALSDPVRLEILDRISSGSEVTVSQLAAVLPITRQAVSRHVRTLEGAGLVKGHQEGREHRYHVDTMPLEDARRWLQRRAASWEGALQRLARYVESDTPTSRDVGPVIAAGSNDASHPTSADDGSRT